MVGDTWGGHGEGIADFADGEVAFLEHLENAAAGGIAESLEEKVNVCIIRQLSKFCKSFFPEGEATDGHGWGMIETGFVCCLSVAELNSALLADEGGYQTRRWRVEVLRREATDEHRWTRIGDESKWVCLLLIRVYLWLN